MRLPVVKSPSSPAIEDKAYQALADYEQPSQLLQVYLKNGDLVAEGGHLILEGLTRQAFVSSEGDDGIVLGLQSDDGAKSMKDFALGLVRRTSCLSCDSATGCWHFAEGFSLRKAKKGFCC